VVSLSLPKQASQTFCVPDKGTPGGNFRFYMGCPANNTDPFNTGGCMLGAAARMMSLASALSHREDICMTPYSVVIRVCRLHWIAWVRGA
jgi:hypothetical protein